MVLKSESNIWLQDDEDTCKIQDLALHASCQRLDCTGLQSQQHLCAPELLRILKLMESCASKAAAEDLLHMPVSIWQGVVPQLFSLLVSAKVTLSTEPILQA